MVQLQLATQLQCNITLQSSELVKYHLNESLLEESLTQCNDDPRSNMPCWSLQYSYIRTSQYHQILSCIASFSKKWSLSCLMSKATIGKFHIPIDQQLKKKYVAQTVYMDLQIAQSIQVDQARVLCITAKTIQWNH